MHNPSAHFSSLAKLYIRLHCFSFKVFHFCLLLCFLFLQYSTLLVYYLFCLLFPVSFEIIIFMVSFSGLPTPTQTRIHVGHTATTTTLTLISLRAAKVTAMCSDCRWGSSVKTKKHPEMSAAQSIRQEQTVKWEILKW